MICSEIRPIRIFQLFADINFEAILRDIMSHNREMFSPFIPVCRKFIT
jgi:hypothetical protein